MKINEIFESIQGEGKYAGYPVLFIRTSGCTRKCSWCDTKYHKDGKEMSVDEVITEIEKSDKKIVVWTGGEPLMYKKEIIQIALSGPGKYYHIETNGDLLEMDDLESFGYLQYISCSPKNLEIIKKVYNILDNLHPSKYDIKSVIKKGFQEEFIKYSTMLMPLTEDVNGPVDKQNEKYVWNKCIETEKKFCLRQHVKVWGQERGK